MKKDIYIFLLGVFGITEISVTSFRMPVAVILMLPFAVTAISHYPHYKISKKLLVYLSLWIIGLVLSSLYNNTPTDQLIKQIGKIASLFLYFPIAMWCLIGKPSRILLFVTGLGISGILQFFIFPVADFETEVKTSGYANAVETVAAWFISPIIAATCSVLFYKGYRYLTIILACLYGIWAIFNNSRYSLIAYLSLALILFYLGDPLQQMTQKAINRYKRKGMNILLIAIAGVYFASSVYSYMAENNILNERSTQKYYQQKNENALGLATGRADFFLAAYGITKNPIIGYGATPKDKNGINRDFFKLIHAKNLPTHSHILGAWVTAGILGMLFWIYILKIIIMYLKKVYFYNTRMWCFSTIYILLFSWDIFFSPYVGSRGYRLAFIFSYFIISLSDANFRKSLLMK